LGSSPSSTLSSIIVFLHILSTLFSFLYASLFIALFSSSLTFIMAYILWVLFAFLSRTLPFQYSLYIRTISSLFLFRTQYLKHATATQYGPHSALKLSTLCYLKLYFNAAIAYSYSTAELYFCRVCLFLCRSDFCLAFPTAFPYHTALCLHTLISTAVALCFSMLFRLLRCYFHLQSFSPILHISQLLRVILICRVVW